MTINWTRKIICKLDHNTPKLSTISECSLSARKNEHTVGVDAKVVARAEVKAEGYLFKVHESDGYHIKYLEVKKS